jgi:hypothetical protein
MPNLVLPDPLRLDGELHIVHKNQKNMNTFGNIIKLLLMIII